MRRWLCVLLVAMVLTASRADYLSVQRKFQQIEKGQFKKGTRVALSPQELNAYVLAELPKVAPPGVRRPVVRLHGDDRASGSALINFVKLRSAQGKPPNWILRKLLDGEHEVDVTARVRSANGNATVDLERVEISGVPISGGALDFLVQNYLVPNYPEAKIGQPFALKHGIERIEVKSNAAYLVMR